MKTAILGGGLTGITFARLLAEKGIEVTVLEREQDYRGLCRSMKNSGFTFDRTGSYIIGRVWFCPCSHCSTAEHPSG